MDQEDDRGDIIDIVKTPELMMEVLGVSEMEANFILAIERGEISGDINAPEEPPEDT